jgi:DnaJ family protein C protein 7
VYDSFSGKVIPESNFNLDQSGKVGFRLEDSGIFVGNSHPEEADAMQTTRSSPDGTRLTFAVNLESSARSDLSFASSTSDQCSQRRQNKKSFEGMPASNTNFFQSLPTSAIGLAHTEVSASQPNTVLGAQWTEYSRAEPTTLKCTKTENFGYHEDCETWRLRCIDHISAFVKAYLLLNINLCTSFIITYACTVKYHMTVTSVSLLLLK